MKRLIFLAHVFLVLACFEPAMASITYQHLRSSNHVDILLVLGEFQPGDDPQLMAHELDTFPTQLVALHSLGGDRATAMKYGREIRGLGLTTLQIRGSTCSSSCLLAYLGGAERFAEPGAITISRSSFVDSTDNGQGVLSVAATAEPLVKQYLSEMGIAPELFDLSVTVQEGAQRTFTSGEAQQFHIVTEVQDDAVPSAVDANLQSLVAPSETTLTALEFYRQFNASWSGPQAVAMSFLQRSYADTLAYYGKQTSATDVLQEKKVFADRWPTRIYAVRTGSAHANCSNTCSIFGVVDWYAFSATRRKSSSGAVNFALVWNPTTGKVLAETGKIVETDKNPTGPDRITRRWIADATACRLSQGSGAADVSACQSQTTLESGLKNAGWCYQPNFGWHVCEPN